MQEAVLKIKEIGAPPEGFEDNHAFTPPEVLELWDAYQDAVVSIHTPITWEEAEVLVQCCPTDHMAGIEWSLMYTIESCTASSVLKTPDGVERYRSIIRLCNSEKMKELLSDRLEAYLASHR